MELHFSILFNKILCPAYLYWNLKNLLVAADILASDYIHVVQEYSLNFVASVDQTR